MVKEATTISVSQTDTTKAVKPKKKLTKRVSKTETSKPVKEKVVKEKPAKPVKEKPAKPVKEKPVSTRKINSKPVLAKTTGINISPAKVKNIVSNYVLNKDAYATLTELKNAIPRKITKIVDGKEVVENFKGTPVAQLSQTTLDYIAYANSCYDKIQKEEYAKTKIAKLTEPQRKAYIDARTSAKEKFDKYEKNKFLSDNESFDSEAFNCGFDPQFYNDYDAQKEVNNSKDTTNEWKKAIDKVTKLKNRFSTNSRVFLSSLVEYLIKQIASNGTVSCIADNKKIIQLSHILDTTKPGFKERFSLYPLIVHLDTFKQAQEYLRKQTTPEVPAKTTSSDNPDEATPEVVKPDKTTDIFNIDGLDFDKQYQFRYYIGESCREIRMDLAEAEPEGDKDNSVYNYTSVSKIFKNFCSTLVCEFLMRIGQMLEKEIETRGIKTVNDVVISTVISQYHIVCGVDDKQTIDFIRNTTSKYYSYVNDRRTSRKGEKQKGDLQYTE